MSKRLLQLIFYSAFTAAVVTGIHSSWSAADIIQPLPFPHDKHVDLNVQCLSCHVGAMESPQAGIPSAEICALCHRTDRDFPATPSELAAFIDEGREIPWKQIHKLPRHVYFSHRRHVALGKIECSTCHGDLESAVEPVTRAQFPAGLDGMMQCVDCHRREGVGTDCLGCHR